MGDQAKITVTKAHALQAGMYVMAGAVQQATELEQAMQELAALLGKPLDVVKDQVTSLAAASRLPSLVIVERLEYYHHYAAVRKLETPPAKEADQRTVWLWGKQYHWSAELGGRLKLVPGVSPW